MDSKYLLEHVVHCGAVLEECPEKCGAYIPRNELQQHKNQCFHRLTSKVRRTGSTIDEQIHLLRDSIWKNKVVSILTLLKTAVYEGEKEVKELRDTLVSSLQLTNEALRKDILEELFESRRTINAINCKLSNLEKSYIDLQQKSTHNFQHANMQIDNLKFEASNEQHRTVEEREQFYTVLEQMKANFTAEGATIFKLWQEQVQNIHDMKLELEMRCKISRELVNKYNALFDKIEALEIQMQSYSEAIAQQNQTWKSLDLQMKENINYVENFLKDIQTGSRNDNVSCFVCNCFNNSAIIGRLLWRIDQYAEKMDEARRSNAILFSPTFYDKEYGYTLRMELYLNGLGQWKNRHVIGCLRIINGKWDPLLDWPCVLMADVTLKDQDNSTNDLEKFVKTVKDQADEQMEHNSDWYMFIPHSTLDRHSGYTKNNVMFLEIRIKNHKFFGSTTSLV
jgi:hypothetical protein